ncbi:MAG: DUF1524 domain-containing protein [Chloroflexi bacterium]|nr:DUF1524 domain-containing protein [Chloroflexota bacterium]MXX84386.1 DUF1524 domain-containing protein [Chloroflexota bacterium]MYA92844.1 DUF1524 domain-containing protein [Chloroflexota bacterium]MYC56943.1 DUF1524 domain-containing protein [Chloroflexota bacterium]MYD37535.1 DUF1524 domain-containing protein [Chloroflexota bacterium]
MRTFCLLVVVLVAGVANAQINIAPESRCSPYDRADYSYPQSVELRVIAENLAGNIVSPYTSEVFSDRSQTHIEHIVATSEAHDSGLCAHDAATKRQFARDLDNLTLASPSVNQAKSAKDLSEWLPAQNVCWFVRTVVQVKAKYGLSMNFEEASRALQILTENCPSRAECQLPKAADALNCYAGRSSASPPTTAVSTTSTACYTEGRAYVNGSINVRSGAGTNFAKVGTLHNATVSVINSVRKADYCWLQIDANRWIARLSQVLSQKPATTSRTAASQPVSQSPAQQSQATVSQRTVDINGNGRITCKEARAAGLPIPVRKGHWAYYYMRDGDGDGKVCE